MSQAHTKRPVKRKDVKLPLKKEWPPKVSVARSHIHISKLPPDAQDAALQFFGVPKDQHDVVTNLGWGTLTPDAYPKWDTANDSLYQCNECGYLTTSDACGARGYRKYECGNSDCGNATPKTTGAGFSRVSPESIEMDDGTERNIRYLTADDVPNHPSHFGRLKAKFERGVTSDEYRTRVAEDLADNGFLISDDGTIVYPDE